MRQAKRAAEAQGAGESGLSRLIQMHFFNTAGDAAVAISLAGTLFFTVPSGEARGQVALFLGLTMLPFAIVAPLIGPFLDRFAHGRRWAIGATMAIRAFLCWVLAGAVVTDSPWLFPAALGVLVASKAYGVTRAAAVPRLLPSDFTLVKANGRVSMSGIVGVAVSAPLAGLASLAGPEWVLRYAFLLFVAATVAAIRLPARVDSSEGEGDLLLRGQDEGRARTGQRPDPAGGRLRAARQLRAALAVGLPDHVHGVPAAGEPDRRLEPGGADRARRRRRGGRQLPRRDRRVDAQADQPGGHRLGGRWSPTSPSWSFGCAVLRRARRWPCSAWSPGSARRWRSSPSTRPSSATYPHRVQASAFARSDTTLQLAWVIGGFIGIAMPLDPPRLGLGVAAAVLVGWAVFVLVRGPRRAAADVQTGN